VIQSYLSTTLFYQNEQLSTILDTSILSFYAKFTLFIFFYLSVMTRWKGGTVFFFFYPLFFVRRKILTSCLILTYIVDVEFVPKLIILTIHELMINRIIHVQELPQLIMKCL
jgi:hypothetical protein